MLRTPQAGPWIRGSLIPPSEPRGGLFLEGCQEMKACHTKRSSE
jgi:hypothetical protein